NPGLGSQSSLFGIFYYQLAIVIFIMVGGPYHFFEALGRSLEAVPIWEFPKINPGWGELLTIFYTLTGQIFLIALQLGAPVLVAIFMTDIILGLTNRMAPMVNVFEMGFNIKGFLGVLMVYLSLELIVGQMQFWFVDYLRHLEEIVRLFMG
ncbi:MAG: flagellar biosynthetic protein FliR, partial [Deltaproteobacteria bacterium]|nr:flagellar biosynthetic protein FliR [Deltaproteobacteria bacterium]